jgi:hypothetical protein
MQWSAGLAMQLTLTTLRPGGKLRADGFTEIVLRAALLIDLALDERIDHDEELSIDTSATGFGPADLILGEIERYPDRTIGYWVGRGPSVQRALAEQWVADGRWQAGAGGLLGFGRRYTDLPSLSGSPELVVSALDAAQAPGSVRWACMTALAQLAALVGTHWQRPSPELLAACGPAEWLVRIALDMVVSKRSAVAAIGSMGGG